jgi:hypothetical protein
VRFFELLELARQIIELGVADLGLIEDVVPLFVVPNQATQFSDSSGWVQATCLAK